MKPPLIAVPSWVVPGTYAENLAFLKDKREIGAVELLFFLYNAETEALFMKELPEIESYRGRFVFTAHLPDVLRPGHESLVERLCPLVRHFIVHPQPGERAEAEAGAAFLCSLMDRYGKDRFLVENTQSACFERFVSLLPGDIQFCMDCGHLLLEEKSPLVFFDSYGGQRDGGGGSGSRIGEIHLHGLNRALAALDGRLPDHRPFTRDEPWFTALLPRLTTFEGVINMEMFSWEEAGAGIQALGALNSGL